jgi:hypothetical protein
VWDEDRDFQELVREDASIRRHLDPGEIESVFDLAVQLRNVDKIFQRVLGGEG